MYIKILKSPLVKVIADMEMKGIKVDKKSLLKLSEEFESDILKLQKKSLIYLEKNSILTPLNNWEVFFLKI